MSDDAWLDELIAWADKNKIPDYHFKNRFWLGFPRDKQVILSLTTLMLIDNNLTTLPESIGKLINLRVLYLECNNLTALPESIGNLDLTFLDVSNNKLTVLPESIGKLTSLARLNLWGNPIKSLPPKLRHLRRITQFGI